MLKYVEKHRTFLYTLRYQKLIYLEKICNSVDVDRHLTDSGRFSPLLTEVYCPFN
jgi:hypothetical protein